MQPMCGAYKPEKKKKFNPMLFLTLALIGIIIFMGISVRGLTREGTQCTIQPFLYGARRMAEQQENGHMHCSCQVWGDEYRKGYAFNELQENPRSLINPMDVNSIPEDDPSYENFRNFQENQNPLMKIINSQSES